MLHGIDFSFGSGITARQVKDAGFQFVVRYLSGGGAKDISANELMNYEQAGIQVLFVWETTGTDMTSQAKGESDAGAAEYELGQIAAATVRQDLDLAPIFFAADEVHEPDEPGYLRGVSKVIGKARCGIYGGYGSVRQAFDLGLVSYGWQTYAWSTGIWDDRALLRQVANGIKVGPADCDLDEAAYWSSAKVLTANDDYGQWPRPAAPDPKPAAYRHTTNLLRTVDSYAKARGVGLEHLAGVSAEHYTAKDWEALGKVRAEGIPFYTDEP